MLTYVNWSLASSEACINFKPIHDIPAMSEYDNPQTFRDTYKRVKGTVAEFGECYAWRGRQEEPDMVDPDEDDPDWEQPKTNLERALGCAALAAAVWETRAMKVRDPLLRTRVREGALFPDSPGPSHPLINCLPIQLSPTSHSIIHEHP